MRFAILAAAVGALLVPPPVGAGAAFDRCASAAGCLLGSPQERGARASGSTIRISLNSEEVGGNAFAEHPSPSADGRYVAFDSAATNLDPFDANEVSDVFVRDRVDGLTQRVSITPAGVQGNGASVRPAISGDGRYVAFESAATNLVNDDTNGRSDVFVLDRQARVLERVSVATGGAQATSGHSTRPSISADGRYVTFMSAAPDLVGGDTNGVADVFVRDRVAGTTERVSVSSAGAQGDDSSGLDSSISADGRYVCFSSGASNLVAGDTNGEVDIYVHDRQADITERVSVSTAGAQGDGFAQYAAISPDGQFVAFDSWATNLVAGDTNLQQDVFVHDRQADTTQRVSVTATGAQAQSASSSPTITEGGREVAFLSYAELIPTGYSPRTHVYVADRVAGTLERVSVTDGGGEPDNDSYEPAISADGTLVAFSSFAQNLTPGDGNGHADVYARVRTPAPPPAPTVSAVTPASGSNDNSPRVTGTAEAGTTVTLYGSPSCTGPALGSGTAAAFASPGIAISVADNSTTTVYATATNANGTSACSTTFVTYQESTPTPTPTPTPTATTTPTVTPATLRWATATAAPPETVGTLGLIVERVGDATGTTTIAYTTVDGTATATGDYVAASGTVTFDPGETQERVEVTVVDDTLDEGDEQLTVVLSGPSAGATVGTPAVLEFTIVDDDRVDTTITSGPSGPTDNATPSFAFTADPAAGATFECAVDDGAFATCTTPHTTTALADGAHTFRVRAVKPNGSRDLTPATRTFFVDTVRPTVSPLVLGEGRGEGRYAGVVQVTGSASDPAPGSGVKELRCQLDPATVPETASDIRGSCPLNTAAPGVHTAYLAAIDEAGWAGIPVKVTFTILPEPDTTIATGPPAESWHTTATFTFLSSLTFSTFRCRIDQEPFAPCTSPHMTAPLPPGDHTFEVAAISADGVVDPSPARSAFRIEFPRTTTTNCVVSSFPREVFTFFGYGPGCESYSGRPYDDCDAPTQCRRLPSNCPRGAQCTLEARAEWYDADVEWWFAEAFVSSSGPGYGHLYDYESCDAGWGQDRCRTTARGTLLGRPSDLNLFCRADDDDRPENPPRDYPKYGPDHVRRIECTTIATIAPATPLQAVAAGRGVQVAAPGAGTVTVAPGGPAGRTATIAARRPLFKAKPAKVASAGPATVRLRLSRAAGRRLARGRRLPLRLSVAFTPASGGEVTRATRRVVLHPPEKPKRVCGKGKGKRPCPTS